MTEIIDDAGARIPLTKGYVAVVDDEDYEEVARRSWRVFVSTSGVAYATRAADRSELVLGAPTTISMHRQVLGVIFDRLQQVDHRNRNGIDNRKKNLRLCSASQNQANRPKSAGTTSKYKGVSFFKNNGKWTAIVGCCGRSRHLGYYVNEEDAARAYDRAALEEFGEFAWLNFPTST